MAMDKDINELRNEINSIDREFVAVSYTHLEPCFGYRKTCKADVLCGCRLRRRRPYDRGSHMFPRQGLGYFSQHTLYSTETEDSITIK